MAIQAQLYNSENIGFPLGGSQDLMENTCGFNQFYFNSQSQQQYNPQVMQQQQLLQNMYQKNYQNLMQFVPKHNSNYAQSMPCSNSTLTAQLEKQKFEIDRFISLQNERLRLTLQAQRKKETALIMRKYGLKAEYLLKQKDEEIAKATNRTIELEQILKRIEMENQTWQRMAKENEAMVMSLNNTIEQLRENICLSNNRGAEDAESCCDESEEDKTEHCGHNGHHQMMCKSCNSRTSCMIFLPCRHLCSCKDCDTFLHSCPVCKMVKKASIEALI